MFFFEGFWNIIAQEERLLGELENNKFSGLQGKERGLKLYPQKEREGLLGEGKAQGGPEEMLWGAPQGGRPV